MRTIGWCSATMALSVAAIITAQAQEPSLRAAELLKDPMVKAALDVSRAAESQTIDDQIRLCEVPAPSFKEAARGEVVRQLFQQHGLKNVRVDKVGNVLGDRPGAAARPRVVLSAHLDTVFPEDTDVKVKREGAVLRGPGIGDDCRGLAVMLGTIRALQRAGTPTRGSMTFVATVGEEGLGDLRGAKQLFMETLAGTVDRFVSIDGTGLGVTNVAVGSRRYRVTFKGPGGHSYAAFGLPNPIDALGRAIAKIADFEVSRNPRTTFSVGRVGGGTSVNAIPADAWMEVDMRSADVASLSALEARFQKAIDAAVTEENSRWRSPGVLTVVKELVGVRPAGATSASSAIVRIAQDVHSALNLPFVLTESSTDSNIPMSLRIPAITIGSGGRGSNAHAPSESFDTTDSWLGSERALLLMIALTR